MVLNVITLLQRHGVLTNQKLYWQHVIALALYFVSTRFRATVPYLSFLIGCFRIKGVISASLSQFYRGKLMCQERRRYFNSKRFYLKLFNFVFLRTSNCFILLCLIVLNFHLYWWHLNMSQNKRAAFQNRVRDYTTLLALALA